MTPPRTRREAERAQGPGQQVGQRVDVTAVVGTAVLVDERLEEADGFRASPASRLSSSTEDHIDTAHHLAEVLWWQLGHALGKEGSIDGDDLRCVCNRVLLKTRRFGR